MVDAIEQIRKIRKNENIKLKPTPYLKSKYIDEYGVETPVSVRNYQAQGIMNLCVMPTVILGDDTGLGKTLQVLSAIGYVWLVEPHYVPVVVTNKSSLFQWEAEIQKFMQGMEVVTVNGDPNQRHDAYIDFFGSHNQKRKRILIITYDMLFRDLRGGIIGNPVKGKGSTKLKKAAKVSRKKLETAKIALDDFSVILSSAFSEMPMHIREHMSRMVRGFPSEVPTGWIDEHQEQVDLYLKKKKTWEKAADIHENTRLKANPTRQVSGILDHFQFLQSSHPDIKFMLVMDEMHKVKNHKSKIHDSARQVSVLCDRIYGLTATPVKNRLMEFFSLFRIIKPGVFPKISHFMDAFCITKLQPIGGGRKVRIVVGYRNLPEFVKKIEPYYLSRKKHEVEEQLPELITREISCELTDIQEELYDMAEAGLLSTEADPEQDTVLSSLVLCQQAVNSPCLIADEEGTAFDGPSSKEDALLELLQDDLLGRKVIVFSRFERMISRIEDMLDNAKIKSVRITGKETKARDREKSKLIFQDQNSGIDVILITTAGSESINLHSAEYLIFFDSPWSWGDYIQLIGRMIRIGSKHTSVVALHLIAEKQNGKKTIDSYVIKTLRSKKNLADKVAGENLPGGLQFRKSNESMDIFSEMKSGVEAGDKGTLLDNSKKLTSSKKSPKNKKAPVKIKPKDLDEGTVKTIDIEL